MKICPKCNGAGVLFVPSARFGDPCEACDGTGRAREYALSAPMAEALNSIMRDTVAMIATDPEMTLEQARAMCAHALRTIDRSTSATRVDGDSKDP